MSSITIIIGVLFLLAIVSGFIDWRGIAEKWVGNNPGKARVYVKSGEQVEAVMGKRVYPSDDGMFYGYKWHGDECVVALPRDYPYEFLRGRRIIGVVGGRVVASPLGEDIHGDVGEGSVDVALLSLGNAVVDLSKSMTGKKMGWLWLVVVIGVVMVAYFGYTFFLAPESVGQGPVPVTPEQLPGPGQALR